MAIDTSLSKLTLCVRGLCCFPSPLWGEVARRADEGEEVLNMRTDASSPSPGICEQIPTSPRWGEVMVGEIRED